MHIGFDGSVTGPRTAFVYTGQNCSRTPSLFSDATGVRDVYGKLAVMMISGGPNDTAIFVRANQSPTSLLAMSETTTINAVDGVNSSYFCRTVVQQTAPTVPLVQATRAQLGLPTTIAIPLKL